MNVSRRSATDRIPEGGQAVEVLALGRSGGSLCGRTRVGATKVLVRLGLAPVRPVAGELFTLDVTRRTRENGLWMLEGTIRAPRLSPSTLRLEPLALIPRPEAGERQHELETIIPRIPRFDASGFAAIEEISALWEAGEMELAELLAGELLARDLRCLEAHALLGSFFLDGPVEERWTERALRHYRVGVTIGELSLGDDFEGVLPWRWRGNRALLRCLDGYGRCLERIGEARSARNVFERSSMLAPEAPLGVGGQEPAS